LEPIPPLAGGSETAKESHISAQIYMRTKFHQHNPSKRRKKLPKPPFVATSPTSNLAEDFKKSQRRKMEKKKRRLSKEKRRKHRQMQHQGTQIHGTEHPNRRRGARNTVPYTPQTAQI